MSDESTQCERRSELGDSGVGGRAAPAVAPNEHAAGGAAGAPIGATAGEAIG